MPSPPPRKQPLAANPGSPSEQPSIALGRPDTGAKFASRAFSARLLRLLRLSASVPGSDSAGRCTDSAKPPPPPRAHRKGPPRARRLRQKTRPLTATAASWTCRGPPRKTASPSWRPEALWPPPWRRVKGRGHARNEAPWAHNWIGAF